MHAVFHLVSSLSHCAATSKHLGLIAPGHESFYPGLCRQKGVPTFFQVLPCKLDDLGRVGCSGVISPCQPQYHAASSLGK